MIQFKFITINPSLRIFIPIRNIPFRRDIWSNRSMNTWQDEVHFDVLPLDLVREQLQENLISYLSMLGGVDLDDDRDHVIDDICQIVVDTFKEAGV